VSSSARRHAGSLDDGGRRGSLEIIDQRLGSVALLGIGGKRRCEYQLLLQLAGEGACPARRPGAISTLVRKTPISASPWRRPAESARARLAPSSLPSSSSSIPRALEHFCYVSAGGARRHVGPRKRAASSAVLNASVVEISGASARPPRTITAVADPGDVDCRFRRKASLGRSVLEDVDRHHHDVERRGRVGPAR